MTPAEIGQHNTLLLVGIGALAVQAALAFLPKPRCKECPHCRDEAAAAKRKRHADIHRSWGTCGDKDCVDNKRPRE